MRTTIDLGATDLPLDERSVGVHVTRHLDARRAIGASVGAIVDGSADAGGLAAVSGTWLAVLERPRRPFVQLSVSASGSRTTGGLTSFDARIGAMVGKAFGPVVPYVAARAFGGPVFYQGESGGDRYHVTLGGGVSVRLPASLGVFVEVMPLGEQSAVAGVTARL